MIESIVDTYKGIVEFALVILIGLGAYLGYHMIPEVVILGGKSIEFNGFGKVLVGGGLVFIAEAIVLGPLLVLIDARDGIKAMQRELSSINKEIKQMHVKPELKNIESQLDRITEKLNRATEETVV